MTANLYDTNGERRAFFAGSFNPFTTGHASIVERGLTLFDKIVIGVGVNPDKPQSDAARCVGEIQALYDGDSRVEVVAYSTLSVDAAATHRCRWMLRGARTAADFEAERTLADINRQLSGIDTVILPTLPELAIVSSSLVRELRIFGRDASKYLPSKQSRHTIDHL